MSNVTIEVMGPMIAESSLANIVPFAPRSNGPRDSIISRALDLALEAMSDETYAIFRRRIDEEGLLELERTGLAPVIPFSRVRHAEFRNRTLARRRMKEVRP